MLQISRISFKTVIILYLKAVLLPFAKSLCTLVCLAYKEQKMRKDAMEKRKDVETTAMDTAAADDDDDVVGIPEEIPDDDSAENESDTVS